MKYFFPDGFRVLIVDDDVASLKILERMLTFCEYTVTSSNKSGDALDILRSNKGGFDLVIADIRLPGMDGFRLLEHIENEFGLPVIMMSDDSKEETVMESFARGASFYLAKPVKMDQIQSIWQHAIRRQHEKTKMIERSAGEGRRGGGKDVNVDGEGSSATDSGVNRAKKKQIIQKGKRLMVQENSAENHEDNDDEENSEASSRRKRSRVLWNADLHDHFITTVSLIGIDRAVPKKILEFMKVPGLSRENIASHLQKYRLYLKRVEEANICAVFGAKPPNPVPSKSIFAKAPRRRINSLLMFENRHNPSPSQLHPPPRFQSPVVGNNNIPSTYAPNIPGSRRIMQNQSAEIPLNYGHISVGAMQQSLGSFSCRLSQLQTTDYVDTSSNVGNMSHVGRSSSGSAQPRCAHRTNNFGNHRLAPDDDDDGDESLYDLVRDFLEKYDDTI